MKRTSLRQTVISVGLFTLIACMTLSLAESPIPQAESPRTSEKPKITGLLPHGDTKDGLMGLPSEIVFEAMSLQASDIGHGWRKWDGFIEKEHVRGGKYLFESPRLHRGRRT